MGFSVTASSVVFAFAMLTAFSAALAGYWTVQDHIEDSRRIQDRRVIDATRTSLAMVGTPSYNAGANRYTFTFENTGSVGLDYTEFEYLIDGVVMTAQEAGYPKLNGQTSSSKLLLPGDELECRMSGITVSPTNLQIATEFGPGLHYP